VGFPGHGLSTRSTAGPSPWIPPQNAISGLLTPISASKTLATHANNKFPSARIISTISSYFYCNRFILSRRDEAVVGTGLCGRASGRFSLVRGISGDTIEWRSVKVIVAALIRVFRSETRISHVAIRLTDRHSGHHTQFKAGTSKVSPGIPKKGLVFSSGEEPTQSFNGRGPSTL
jgi:hypothetical protein